MRRILLLVLFLALVGTVSAEVVCEKNQTRVFKNDKLLCLDCNPVNSKVLLTVDNDFFCQKCSEGYILKGELCVPEGGYHYDRKDLIGELQALGSELIPSNAELGFAVVILFSIVIVYFFMKFLFSRK